MGDAPFFFQINGLMVIHNRGKFHQDSICGSKVSKIFKCFRGDAAAIKWALLGGFLALSAPNMAQIC